MSTAQRTHTAVSFLLAAGCILVGDSVAGEPLPLKQRIAERDYPSVFQAWNPAEVEGDESPLQTQARHDLLFHAADYFALQWDAKQIGLATRFTTASLQAGRQRRAQLLKLNPTMVLLCEIRFRDAHHTFLPADSPWWARDDRGQPRIGWAEGGYQLLDFANRDFQRHVAQRAKAAVESGVFDGVFLDWWHEDDDRVALLKKIRQAVGEHALILVNANDKQSPRSAPFINGHYLECYRSQQPENWSQIAESLRWAEANLRAPRINCLETWFVDSRADMQRMRATTTLGLTCSDGYVLFADPNPLPTADHLHDWYSLWDAKLGEPVAPGQLRSDGSVLRQFRHGYAAYNPPGGSTTVRFAEPYRRFSTGHIAKTHPIGPLDGDLFFPAATDD